MKDEILTIEAEVRADKETDLVCAEQGVGRTHEPCVPTGEMDLVDAEQGERPVSAAEVERLVREAYLRGRNEAIEAKMAAEADFDAGDFDEDIFCFRESVW